MFANKNPGISRGGKTRTIIKTIFFCVVISARRQPYDHLLYIEPAEFSVILNIFNFSNDVVLNFGKALCMIISRKRAGQRPWFCPDMMHSFCCAKYKTCADRYNGWTSVSLNSQVMGFCVTIAYLIPSGWVQ